MPTRPRNAQTKNAQTKTKTETQSKHHSSEIQAPKGKLGVMIPGMGAVATTFVAGVAAIRKGLAKPIGSLTQMGKNKMDLAEQVRADIREFRKSSRATRLVTIWCGSTETFLEPTAAHESVKAFEKAMTTNDEAIAPSMIYAYASLTEGVPFANGAPNLTVDLPVMRQLSRENEAPICGKDYKTGQTLIKTILAPGFKARMIGLNGWFSTNILG